MMLPAQQLPSEGVLSNLYGPIAGEGRFSDASVTLDALAHLFSFFGLLEELILCKQI